MSEDEKKVPAGHTVADHGMGMDLDHEHDGDADHDHDFEFRAPSASKTIRSGSRTTSR